MRSDIERFVEGMPGRDDSDVDRSHFLATAIAGPYAEILKGGF